MKTIEVVAAVIRDGEGRILATHRGSERNEDGGNEKDSNCNILAECEKARLEGRTGWEFPGGKAEQGETLEEALRREIMEELSAKINVGDRLCTVEYDYPLFHITMHCFLCTLVSEAMHLNEHTAARWLAVNELDGLRWLPADEKVVKKIKERLI